MTPYENITIAVNKEDIEYGTMVNIEGVGIRLAQSNNRSVEQGVIEVYFKTHESVEAFENGEKRVFLVKQV